MLVPNLSRPVGLTRQGAQVMKKINPVRTGQPGEGHAADVREIAEPRSICCEEN
jgi:hypothetical protein